MFKNSREQQAGDCIILGEVHQPIDGLMFETSQFDRRKACADHHENRKDDLLARSRIMGRATR